MNVLCSVLDGIFEISRHGGNIRQEIIFGISKKNLCIFPFEMFKNLPKLWVPSSQRVYFVHRWDLRNLQTERQHRRATLGKESRRQAAQPENIYMRAFHALPQIISFYFTMISSLEICRVGGHSSARFTCDSSEKLFELIFIHLDNIFGVREHLLNAHFPCASSDILLEMISIITTQKRKG